MQYAHFDFALVGADSCSQIVFQGRPERARDGIVTANVRDLTLISHTLHED